SSRGEGDGLPPSSSGLSRLGGSPVLVVLSESRVVGCLFAVVSSRLAVSVSRLGVVGSAAVVHAGLPGVPQVAPPEPASSVSSKLGSDPPWLLRNIRSNAASSTAGSVGPALQRLAQSSRD